MEKIQSKSLNQKAFEKLIKDKIALGSFLIIFIYICIALLCKFGWLAAGYNETVGESYLPPSWPLISGTDLFGRNVLLKALQGTRISMSIGFVVVCIAVPIGVTMGALAGYFRGWVDDVIVWLYSTLESIPYLLLILAMSYALKTGLRDVEIPFFSDKGMFSIFLALGLTSWVSLARVVRGEFIKHRELDYVQAARALNAGSFRIIFYHILPNVFHIVIINASLIFVMAIKAEVILSFLGVGVQDLPSWGIMISDAGQELVGRGVYWQLLAATLGMFFIVLALNLFADAIRDAFDPRMEQKV